MGPSLCCTRTIPQQCFLSFFAALDAFRVVKSYSGFIVNDGKCSFIRMSYCGGMKTKLLYIISESDF